MKSLVERIYGNRGFRFTGHQNDPRLLTNLIPVSELIPVNTGEKLPAYEWCMRDAERRKKLGQQCHVMKALWRGEEHCWVQEG